MENNMDNIIHDLMAGIDLEVDILDHKKVRVINFDNAATTPPFKSVIESIGKLSEYYGSIGRGAGHKAEITTRLYHESKEYLLDFFNIKEKNKYTVIYVSNTTDGINKLSRIINHKDDEVILSTRMEHHSNDLPWRRYWNVDYIEVDELGRIKLNEYKEKLKSYNGRVKYVTVAGASNVTGYINDILEV